MAQAAGYASAAANAATGNYIGAAVSFVSTLFGGGSKPTAEERFQGFQTQGAFTPGGFLGNVTAFFSGEPVAAIGETNSLQGVGPSLVTQYANDNVSDSDLSEYFSRGGPAVPVSVKSSTAATIFADVSGQITNAIHVFLNSLHVRDAAQKEAQRIADEQQASISNLISAVTKQPAEASLPAETPRRSLASDSNLGVTELQQVFSWDRIILVIIGILVVYLGVRFFKGH